MSEPVLRMLREALWLVLLLSAPPVGAALVVGLISAVAQSASRIEERTLSVVPRLVAVGLALALAGPWIAQHLVAFTTAALEAVPSVARR
jgi:flagellar biosynthesis protein FliQ